MPKPIKKEIIKALESYQQRVADILTKQGVKAHVVGDLKAYKKLAPIMIDFSSVQKGAKEFGVKYGALLRNEGATMIHGKKVAWLAESMKDTRVKVSNIINEGVRTGKGTDAIARELRGTLIRDKNYEYKRIARTETGNITAAAADKRYTEEGVEEVDWLCGQKPCEKCAQYCGKRYKIDEAPDLLVHPNCTCDKAPVVTRRVREKITEKVESPRVRTVEKFTLETDTLRTKYALRPWDADVNRFGAGTKISFTKVEDYAVRQYKSSNYSQINSKLRGTKPKLGYAPMPKESIDDVIKNLDAAIEKSVLPRDVDVVRGISPNTAKSLVKSNTCTDLGFMSTTFDPEEAVNFAKYGSDGYKNMMVFKVKKGANALVWTSEHEEAEVLLERGLKLKCTAISEVKTLKMPIPGKPSSFLDNVRLFIMEMA